MYRKSSPASQERKQHLWAYVANTLFLLGYFTFLPIILTVILNWVVYSFTLSSLYQERWMMPTLMLLSTFLAGALMRQKMEDETGGMFLFFWGILALIAFAALTHYDIMTSGGVYSRFMPKLLRFYILDYIYFLPGTGLAGMLFYKYFTLKHYS